MSEFDWDEDALMETALIMLVDEEADREASEGCDCTELCPMGPTCPGGMLAGLPGTGCWRQNRDDEGRSGARDGETL